MGGHVASPRLVPQPNHLGLAWPSQAKSALGGQLLTREIENTGQKEFDVKQAKLPSSWPSRNKLGR
jgi:hypothetical protein